jgi:hypothetical protein
MYLDIFSKCMHCHLFLLHQSEANPQELPQQLQQKELVRSIMGTVLGHLNPSMSVKLFAFDLETTSRCVDQARIVEIAVFDVKSRAEYSSLVNIEGSLPASTRTVTGR